MGLQILCKLKTYISTGWPGAMELYYKFLTLIGHFKKTVHANLKETIEKLIRIYMHLAENGTENCAVLVWNPGNKQRVYEGDGIIIEI